MKCVFHALISRLGKPESRASEIEDRSIEFTKLKGKGKKKIKTPRISSNCEITAKNVTYTLAGVTQR